MGRLDGKVILITGAGSGLGRECSRLFSREGASIVAFDIVEERALETARLVEADGGSIVPVVGDVGAIDQVGRAVAAAEENFGGLDAAFANAGIVSRGGVSSIAGRTPVEFQHLTVDDWESVMRVNLTGVFNTAHQAVPALRRRGGGVILATSSAASFVAYHGIAAYCATKAGVNGLVRGLALDLGKFGIRVNALCPTHGMSPNFLMELDAPVVGHSYEEMDPGWTAANSPIPLKLDSPPTLRDNAYAALFLISDESRYMSGVCLPSTDGGTLSRVAIVFEEDASHAAYVVDA